MSGRRCAAAERVAESLEQATLAEQVRVPLDRTGTSRHAVLDGSKPTIEDLGKAPTERLRLVLGLLVHLHTGQLVCLPDAEAGHGGSDPLLDGRPLRGRCLGGHRLEACHGRSVARTVAEHLGPDVPGLGQQVRREEADLPGPLHLAAEALQDFEGLVQMDLAAAVPTHLQQRARPIQRRLVATGGVAATV